MFLSRNALVPLHQFSSQRIVPPIPNVAAVAQFRFARDQTLNRLDLAGGWCSVRASNFQIVAFNFVYRGDDVVMLGGPIAFVDVEVEGALGHCLGIRRRKRA